MLGYFKFLKTIWIASWKIESEYRFNFFLRILTDIFWYISQVMIFEVLFLYTPSMGAWRIEHIRVFLGLLFTADALYMIFFHENLDRFSDRVRRGELDLLLTKPMDAQFFVSLNRLSLALLGNLSLAIAYLTWALNQKNLSLNPFMVLSLIILIPCGVLSVYAVRFMLSILALIFVRAENLQYLWYQVYRLGLRPDSIYHPSVRVLILTVLPVGLVASLPTRVLLLEDQPIPWILLALGSTFFLNFLARKLWLYSLKFYSSASS